jgi:hypothetical protein
MQRQNAVEIADIQLDNRLRSKPQRGQRQIFARRKPFISFRVDQNGNITVLHASRMTGSRLPLKEHPLHAA